MSELKRCPFCGGDASLEGGNETLSEGACWWVQCQDTACFCSIGCHYLSDDGASAIETWNRRAQPAQAGQVLTDDALWELWNAQGSDDMSQSEAMSFARAVEAAVLAKRVPMTNAQIRRLYAESWSTAAGADFQQAVRAAEKFHGIVGEKGGQP